MTYFKQTPKEKLREYQVKATRIRIIKNRDRLLKSIELWDKNHDIQNVTKELNITKSGAYRIIARAKRYKKEKLI